MPFWTLPLLFFANVFHLFLICKCYCSQTTAYVPELQKLSGPQKLKETGKARGKTSKKARVDDDNNDDIDNPTKKEDQTLGKKGAKAGAKGREASKRKKTEESDDDNDGDTGTDNDDDSDQVEKRKPAPAKKQSKKSVQSNQNSRSARSKAK